MRKDRESDAMPQKEAPDDEAPALADSGDPSGGAESGMASPVETALRGEPADGAALLAHFANTTIPLPRRKQDVQRLARARNDAAKAALMALGDAHLYLNRYAVEALGNYRDADTRRYLQEKLREPDALVVCAAVRALARSAGAGAVPDIAAVIRNNRRRADGHDEMVCQAAAETLGHIASARAVPVLAEELLRSEEPGWSKEYGSAVIVALKNIGAPEGRAAMLAYADRLEARLPDDPLARAYFEAKIREARAAAEDMTQ